MFLSSRTYGKGIWRFIPAEMRRDLPVIRADPTTIAPVLDDILANPGQLYDISRRFREFVERYHALERAAEQVLEQYPIN